MVFSFWGLVFLIFLGGGVGGFFVGLILVLWGFFVYWFGFF